MRKNGEYKHSFSYVSVLIFVIFILSFIILNHREGQKILFGPEEKERVIDESTGWKTYYDKHLNISFEYPKDSSRI